YNTSYIFIPFHYTEKKYSETAKNRHFPERDENTLLQRICRKIYCEQEKEIAVWEPVRDELRYILKYVADKFICEDDNRRQCFHYRLNEMGRSRYGLGDASDWFLTEEHTYDEQKVRFRFQITSVQLFCFTTSICMAAFQVCFDDDDPIRISTAQYYLRKVSKEKIAPERHLSQGLTMLTMAQQMTEVVNSICDLIPFYYAVDDSDKRANMFTCLEVMPKEDYKQELYFLRRCYRKGGYYYLEDKDADAAEIYYASRDIIWGITSEASVCLTCPEMGREKFLKNTFYDRFRAEYLMMYILLLHQKYVLYLFMTKIEGYTYHSSEKLDNRPEQLDKSLEELENYQYQLYKFETDFVFSCITEVPQYQKVYEKMSEAFALRKMYDDVHEPLVSLSEVRRQHSEQLNKKQDAQISSALFMLSLLVFFSALIDSFDFAASFFGIFMSLTAVRVIQAVFIIFILGILIYVLKKMFSSRR
ncbi:MAG: hypothetical protein LUE14_07025, partial [Clostridiales bacterium]|nr:hypothetical protein [Clostridiales bacterium]